MGAARLPGEIMNTVAVYCTWAAAAINIFFLAEKPGWLCVMRPGPGSTRTEPGSRKRQGNGVDKTQSVVYREDQ